MKIKLIGERVLVKPEKIKEVTTGGIHLPDQSKEQVPIGVVIESNIDGIKKNDRVYFEKYSGSPIETPEGEELIFMREDNILAKHKNSPNKANRSVND